MKTFLRFRSMFCFALLFAFLLSFNSFSQDKKFVGVKTIKEGKNIKFQTEAVQNTSGNFNSPMPKIAPTNKNKYVLGGNVIWSFQDPQSMNNFNKVTGDAKNSIVGWGLNSMRASLYTDVNNSPAWEFPTAPFDPVVSISDDGNIIGVSRGVDFCLLDKATGNINYQLLMPDSLYASQSTVSRSGKYAVVLAQPRADSVKSSRIYFLTTGSTPAVKWIYDLDNSIITNWTGARFSTTSPNLVINGRNHLYVFDTTGTLKWQTFVDNSEAPAVISGDGNVIATADNSGFVKTFLSTDGSTYNLLWQFRIPLTSPYTNWASSVAISANGRIIIAGTLDWTNGGTSFDGRVFAFDTFGGGIPKWVYNGCGDMVDDASLSDDGKVAAIATWGDIDQTKPDLIVFDVETGQPTFQVNSAGSFFTVDLSHDGSRVIAGGKASHARQLASGGLVYFASINLGGGNISGNVNINGTDKSGVLVKVDGINKSALTQSNGDYIINNVSAGTYKVNASKPGYNFGSVSNVVVTEGNTTSNINFNLAQFTTTPPVISATTTLIRVIKLNFTGLLTDRMKNEIAKAVGDTYKEDYTGNTISVRDKNTVIPNDDLPFGLTDSIAVFRSSLPGGPYTRVGAVLRSQTNYTDSTVYPLKNYYYVVNVFNETGQSIYSNEVLGKVSDTLITFSFTAPQGSVPTIDGILSPGEWSDAFKVDVSDVLGYSGGTPKPQGSVYMYFKFDNTKHMLYVAGEDFLNPTLDDNEGIALYCDDNNNNTYEPQNGLSILQEGNYWAYWHPYGSNLRFRRLYTGGGAGTIDTIQNAQVNFSDASGHVTGEVAIPMGFLNGNQLQIFAPDKTPGIGAFMSSRPSGSTIFDGWWPQTMNSLFNPVYFGDIKINATLAAPPQIPNNITVSKDKRDLVVSWNDPTLGLNNDPLPSPPKIRVYKFNDIEQTISAGVQTYKDTSVECPYWYEYKLDAYIISGSDTLFSPISRSVGDFACKTPEMTKLSYDDGQWEAFYVVNFNWDGNKFALRFTPTYYPARVLRLEALVNNSGHFDFTVQADSSGYPGKIVAGPYRVSSGIIGQAVPVIFTLPGHEPPFITEGDFWVVMNYLPESPGDPGIGVDGTPPNQGRGMYYSYTTGWQNFGSGNIMMKSYIADTALFVDVKEPMNTQQPLAYNLLQNYPNPFNPSTVIYYQLPESQSVTLEVYNSLGQKVTTLVNGVQNAGKHSITWNGRNEYNIPVSSGMYMYRIKAGNYVQSRKMLLMK